MYLVSPGATTLSTIMRWDEMPLRRLSWLTPNCRAIHLLFNILCMLQESNVQEKQSVGDLFILTAFNCTKVKPLQLAVLVIMARTHVLAVLILKTRFFLAPHSRDSHSLGSTSAWLKSRETKQTLRLTHHLIGLQLCNTLKLAKWPWWGKHQLSIIDYPDFHLRAPLSSLINISQKVVQQ